MHLTTRDTVTRTGNCAGSDSGAAALRRRRARRWALGGRGRVRCARYSVEDLERGKTAGSLAGLVRQIAAENRQCTATAAARSNASTSLFFFQAEDGIRDHCVTGVQTCALPI